MSFLLRENEQLFFAINHVAGHFPWLDGLMIFGANTAIFCWPLLLLVLWGLPRSWRSRSLRPDELAIRQECRSTVLWMAGACLLAYGLNLGLEHLVFEPRPFVSHPVHLLITHPADASFPSDHTAVSLAIVGMLGLSMPALLAHAWNGQMGRWRHREGWQTLWGPLVLLALSILLACGIGLARVFVGVHYPGDILGGALSGLCAAAIMTGVRRRLAQPTSAVIRLAERWRLA